MATDEPFTILIPYLLLIKKYKDGAISSYVYKANAERRTHKRKLYKSLNNRV